MNNMDTFMDQARSKELSGNKTDEERLEYIEAHIIETMFLAPLMDNEAYIDLVRGNDEEEEDFVGKSDFKFYNKMMMRKIAMQLAKQDLLGMKRQYLKRGKIIGQ